MIHSQQAKNFSFQILITLFLALQIAACSGGGGDANTAADDIPLTDNAPITDNNPSFPGTASATDIDLSWAAPSEREDNKPIALSEIAGYKVYYGTSQRNYSNSIDISGGNIDNYTFKNFSTGIYYFAITTLDTAGRESQYSAEIIIVV